MNSLNKDLIYDELSKIYMKFIYKPERMSCSEIKECITYFLDNFIDSKYSSTVGTKINITRELYRGVDWEWIMSHNSNNFKIYKNINLAIKKHLISIDKEIYNQINYKDYLYFHKFKTPLSDKYNIGVHSEGVFGGILKNGINSLDYGQPVAVEESFFLLGYCLQSDIHFGSDQL